MCWYGRPGQVGRAHARVGQLLAGVSPDQWSSPPKSEEPMKAIGDFYWRSGIESRVDDEDDDPLKP